jgi:hypothetical protein
MGRSASGRPEARGPAPTSGVGRRVAPPGRSGRAGRVERQGPGDPPEGIGGIVRRILGDRRMRKGVALGRLARAWPQVVGAQLARQTVPQALDEGGLLVSASSAAWGSQVRFLAAEIAAKANMALGADEVRTVRVMVASERPERLRRNRFGGSDRFGEGAGKGGAG